MALPTVLTAAQVGGSADAAELPVRFNSGANAGLLLLLLVARTDVNIPPSVADGSITVADRRTFSVGTISGIAPTTMVGADGGTLTVNGSGFNPGDTVFVNGVTRTTTYVNSGQLTAVIAPASLTAGSRAVIVRSGAGFDTNSVNLTVT